MICRSQGYRRMSIQAVPLCGHRDPQFSRWFITSKIVAVLATLIAIFVVPTFTPLMIAGNILLAVAEAGSNGLYLNATVGVVLALVCVAFFLYTANTPHRMYMWCVAAFLVCYALWNTHFNAIFGVVWYTSLPQNIVPLLLVGVAVWRGPKGDDPLWWFALARAICILILCVHVVDPTSCHVR